MRTIKHRIPSLDGLRAVSISLVLLGHGIWTMPFSFESAPYAQRIMDNAQLGVMMFFVISGYLITRLLLSELKDRGHIDLKAFYVRRAFRIFPAAYVYLLVIAGLVAAGVLSISPGEYLSASVFLWNYKHFWDGVSPDGFWYLGHFWSLAVEEQFYLLWPLTLFFLKPFRSRRIAAAILLLLPLIRVATYFLVPAVRGQMPIMLHTAADPLLYGCLFALLEGSDRFEAVVRRLCTGPAVAGMTAYLFLVMPEMYHRFGGMYWCTIGRTMESAFLACILLWSVRNAASGAGRLLNSRLLVHIGVLSYSLYLWQELFLTVRNDTWSGLFPVNFFCAYAAALLSYHLIEQPFLKLRVCIQSGVVSFPYFRKYATAGR